MRRRLLFVPLCLFAVGCGTTSMRPDPSVSHSRDLLLAGEIVVSRVTDVYQAIAQLRPEFLRFAGRPGLSGIDRETVKVYLDDMELGGVDLLHAMPVDHVTAIRYLGASQATLRWGPSNGHGAILISTTRYAPRATP